MNRILLFICCAFLLQLATPAAAMVNKKRAAAPAEAEAVTTNPVPDDKNDPPAAAIINPPAPGDDSPGERLALFSVILGIFSLVFFIVGIIIGPFAVMAGVRALRKLTDEPAADKTPKHMAIAGIVMGAAAIIGCLLVVTLLFIL